MMADMQYVGRIARENLAGNEEIEQSASSASFYKNLMEIAATAVIGGGFGKIDESYANGIVYAGAAYAGIKLGELIGRKIRNMAKLEPDEIEAIAQYSEQLDWAVSSCDKEAIYKMLGRIANYIENLFYEKKNTDIFNTPTLVEMDNKFRAAVYKIGKTEKPPTALNTPS